MTIELQDDNNLSIKLVSYNAPTLQTESFYFLEMSTLQLTLLIDPERKIVSSEIVAYTTDNSFLDKDIIESFLTISDFNNFFIKHQDFYIHNCIIQLDSETVIRSHDDGEVSIKFKIENPDSKVIDAICMKYSLDKNIIETIKTKPGHYFSIDNNSVGVEYKDFDEYVTHGRDN